MTTAAEPDSGGWGLAVDLGTSFLSACWFSVDRVVPVEVEGSRRIPSAVLLDREGRLVAGELAQRGGLLDPDRLERTPKRAVGRPFILLGGQRVPVSEALAAQLRLIADEAVRQHGGLPPTSLVLTHPARWGQDRCSALAQAAEVAGLPHPTLVPEPVAAAARYLAGRGEGTTVAVYDLGGGTFDTAVVRATSQGPVVLGEPGGEEDLGGEQFDYALFRLVLDHLEDRQAGITTPLMDSAERKWQRAAADLLDDVRRAKEALSTHQRATVYFAPLDTEVDLTRGELEDLIRGDVDSTVRELARTISTAGLTPGQVGAIHLVGGSSRIPLVSRLQRERFGDVLQTFDDPKLVVVDGAAELMRGGWTLRSPTDNEPSLAPEAGEADPVEAGAPEAELSVDPEPPTRRLPPRPEPALPDEADARPRRLGIVVGAAVALVVVVLVVALLVSVLGPKERPDDGPDADAGTQPTFSRTVDTSGKSEFQELIDFLVENRGSTVKLQIGLDAQDGELQGSQPGVETPSSSVVVSCAGDEVVADCPADDPWDWQIWFFADGGQGSEDAADGTDWDTPAISGTYQVVDVVDERVGSFSSYVVKLYYVEVSEGSPGTSTTFEGTLDENDADTAAELYGFLADNENLNISLDLGVEVYPPNMSYGPAEHGDASATFTVKCPTPKGSCTGSESWVITVTWQDGQDDFWQDSRMSGVFLVGDADPTDDGGGAATLRLLEP